MSGVVDRGAAMRVQVKSAALDSNVSRVSVRDIRFPTSKAWTGAIEGHAPPDQSLAFITIDTSDGQKGFGFAPGAFPDNQGLVPALEYLGERLVGQSVETLFESLLRFNSKQGTDPLGVPQSESPLFRRAQCAITTALWDLFAKSERQPLWRILCSMEPRQIVKLANWRHVRDAVDPGQVRERLEEAASERASRTGEQQLAGLPSFISLPGHVAETDGALKTRLQDAIAEGWSAFNIRLPDDLARLYALLDLVRTEIDDHRSLLLQADGRWTVAKALEVLDNVGSYAPIWLSDATHRDDTLGFARLARASTGLRIAVGSSASSVVQIKQLLQAKAAHQLIIDPFRLGGINQAITALLMADYFGVRCSFSADYAGQSEVVQHLAIFDRIAISGASNTPALGFEDQLHQHFVDPILTKGGRTLLPPSPGCSTALKSASMSRYAFPKGAAWRPKSASTGK